MFWWNRERLMAEGAVGDAGGASSGDSGGDAGGTVIQGGDAAPSPVEPGGSSPEESAAADALAAGVAAEVGASEGGDAGGDVPASPIDWDVLRGTLPEDMRSSGMVSSAKSLQSFVKHALDNEKHIGKKGIIEPDWKDEADVSRFYSDLGRPDSPSDYDLGDFEAPEGIDWKPEMQQAMLDIMHKQGLGSEQAAGILKSYAYIQKLNVQQMEAGVSAKRISDMTELSSEWGAQFEANVVGAGKAFTALFGNEADSLAHIKLDHGGELGDDKRFIKAFSKAFGNGLREDVGTIGEKHAAPNTLTPADAQGEIANLQADPEFMARYQSGEKAAFNRMQSLYNMAYVGEG